MTTGVTGPSVEFFVDSHGDWRWTARTPLGTFLADSATPRPSRSAAEDDVVTVLLALLDSGAPGVHLAVSRWLAGLDPERLGAIVQNAADHGRAEH